MLEEPKEINPRKRDLDRELVYAQWLQNFGGGMGFAVAISAVLLWFMDWRWALSIAFTIGFIVFGISMGFRAYLDEVMTEQDRKAMLDDIEKLKESRSLLEQRLRVAQSDLQSAQAELLLRMGGTRTRTAVDLTPRAEMTPAEEAIRRNAEKLLHQAYATGKWGKDTAKAKLNMSNSDWYAARDMMISRGVAYKSRGSTMLTASTLGEALTLLSKSTKTPVESVRNGTSPEVATDPTESGEG